MNSSKSMKLCLLQKNLNNLILRMGDSDVGVGRLLLGKKEPGK